MGERYDPYRVDREAAARLALELAKPLPAEQWEEGTDDVFNPWRLFPCVYGSYSSDFDDMAILVLTNIQQRNWGADNGESLAHEMFREMLCVAHLCDYGTSPRGCFPSVDFEPLLAPLIEKWRQYRARWDE